MMSNQANKAIVLLSGGLDSTTCLAYALKEKYDCYALSFDYGQRHRTELEAAKKIAQLYQVPHEIIHFSLNNLFGTPSSGSALTDFTLSVPPHAASGTIPVTYVPARNTIFLSMALGWAEMLQARAIFIGVSAIDYSGYPDCRPEYICAFQHMANLATKTALEGQPITLHTPLITLSKAETIHLGTQLGVPYQHTTSCYHPTSAGLACGTCDACYFRKKGFSEAQITDPTIYKKSSNQLINGG